MMQGDLPVALGIIRDADAPAYDSSIHQQIEKVKTGKPQRTLHEVLMSGETWEIK
jgi:2-oxoglutarate ferredoxin oxidoreductase subunit beta